MPLLYGTILLLAQTNRRNGMYTHRNFKTKTALKKALAAGDAIGYYQPGPFGASVPLDGVIYLEGPHYPEPHRWYAQAEVKSGIIVKVR